MIQLIPYLLTLMILWDFSLHLYDLLIDLKLTSKKHPLGMYKIADYFAGNDVRKRRSVYNIFWTIYWGFAFILVLLYLLFRA